MICKNCGQQLPDQAQFCDGCGTSQVSEQFGGSGTASRSASSLLGKAIGDEVKARSKDAWAGIQLFAKNPVGGLQASYEMFDPTRAMGVAITFGVLYEVLLFVGIYRLAGTETSMFGLSLPVGELSFKQVFQVIFIGLVPFITLAFSGTLARLIFRGKGVFSGDLYVAGASLLPLGFLSLLSSFLGPANIEVIAALALFAITYSILMLYSGCSRILGIPEIGAAPAVPIMLLLTAWLTKIVISAIVF